MRQKTIRTLMVLLAVTGTWCVWAAPARPVELFPEPEKYAVESVSAALSSTQAGAHADLTTAFRLTEEGGAPYGLTRDIVFALPPGVIGNPQGVPRCSVLQLGNTPEESECPVASQVGISEITLGGGAAGTFTEPVYNMPSPGSGVVARFGMFAGPYQLLI